MIVFCYELAFKFSETIYSFDECNSHFLLFELVLLSSLKENFLVVEERWNSIPFSFHFSFLDFILEKTEGETMLGERFGEIERSRRFIVKYELVSFLFEPFTLLVGAL